MLRDLLEQVVLWRLQARIFEMGDDPGWHSGAAYIVYQALGWFAFTAWSISFWPQVILNYRRKSVVGLHFDFVVFNLTKHSSYLIYNAVLYFSPVVQRQYHEKYGFDEMIPVAPSDVAFSTHATLLTSVMALQLFFYERGSQKLSSACKIISSLVWTEAIIILVVSWFHNDWLSMIQNFNNIQLFMTTIKYIPQVYLNYSRKSTIGWSISNILLDLTGGTANFLQMLTQSIDQNSFVNFSGNVGKVGLSLMSILFDIVFTIQHFCLYTDHSEVAPDDYLQVGDYAVVQSVDPELGAGEHDEGDKTPTPGV
ncbi:hypothetical protein M758_2G052300 [Ceratodon purpureus]|nr:hypothetical protein M758_2G052300 [Ceratodon purpureus]